MLVETEYEAVFTLKEINLEEHQAVITEIFEKKRNKLVLRGEATVTHPEKL